MDRTRRLLLGTPAALALAGCAGLGLPSQLLLSQRELDERLARRFPRTQRVLEVLEITLSQPRVTLLPEQRRLGAAFVLALRERVFDSRHGGHIAFDSGLRWEPQDASLRLAHVDVQRFELDAAPRLLAGQTQRVGRLLAEQLLEGFTLWQMTPEQQQRLQRAGLAVAPIDVTPQGLIVRFEPTRR